jgi:hypothetical protein
VTVTVTVTAPPRPATASLLGFGLVWLGGCHPVPLSLSRLLAWTNPVQRSPARPGLACPPNPCLPSPTTPPPSGSPRPRRRVLPLLSLLFSPSPVACRLVESRLQLLACRLRCASPDERRDIQTERGKGSLRPGPPPSIRPRISSVPTAVADTRLQVRSGESPPSPPLPAPQTPLPLNPARPLARSLGLLRRHPRGSSLPSVPLPPCFCFLPLAPSVHPTGPLEVRAPAQNLPPANPIPAPSLRLSTGPEPRPAPFQPRPSIWRAPPASK